MILKNLFQNKRGRIQKSLIWIVIALALFLLMIIPNYVSAGKTDQYFKGNLTCENMTDTMLWTALAAANAAVNVYFNWTIGTECPGVKSCGIQGLEAYVRIMNVGKADALAGAATAQIGNSSQSPVSSWTGIRYFAYSPAIATGAEWGPLWTCGTPGSPDVCNVTGQGFDNVSKNYTVRLYAEGANNNRRMLVDVFNMKYPWCWTPLIYDANVSVESNSYDQEFTFTIKVTNPSANTTVSLWTRSVGGSWSKEGSNQYCANCSQQTLSFPVTFTSGDIEDKEFKFVSSDNAGYSTDAGNPTSLGTSTNECLDASNDCVFTITDVVLAEGTPNIVNETVNGFTSGITDGWGINWTFSVNVSNPADGVGNINLNLLLNTGNGFSVIETQQCASPCSTSTKFNFYVSNLTGENISSAQYRFNATNTNGSSTATQSFTIEKDDTEIIYILGNNTIANRSGTQTQLFIMQINDTDKKELINNTNVSFEVTYNGVSYGSATNNLSNSTGHSVYYFDPVCAPNKYEVGYQNWRASIPTNPYYKSVTSTTNNVSIRGDIILELTNPTGAANFTQEGTISFLGATTDDCGDSLESTVIYHANSSTNSFECTTNTQIGANAFQCTYSTTLATERGWYNVTMISNKTNHYTNFTSNAAYEGLFYLLPKKRLDNPEANPTAQGWGSPNWNFSVYASSGDPDNNLTVSLYMAKTVNPTTECTSENNCINQTSRLCENCNNQMTNWLKNFTGNDIGTWYYQFKLDDSSVTSTSGTENTVTVEKDDTNLTYGGTGNQSNVTISSTSALLTVRVFDIDRYTFNVTSPSATVVFKLLHDNYDNDEKIIGINVTNESGYATYNLSFTECLGWQKGEQYWKAEINSSEQYYNISSTENFTIELFKPGCEASVNVYATYIPDETFQNRNFTLNATLTAWQENALGVYAIANTTANYGWTIYNQIQNLGTITEGSYDTLNWKIYPTTSGEYQINVSANSSNALNDSANSSSFVVYKKYPETGTLDSLPLTLEFNEETILSWNCESGNYRIANLNLSLNSSGGKLRVYSYNGEEWIDILHSQNISTNGSIEEFKITILNNQLDTNESGKCTIKLKNVNGTNIIIENASLLGYYSEEVLIKDIVPLIGSTETTGAETDEEVLNFSIKIVNTFSTSNEVSLTLNITNSSGEVVNTTTNSSIILPADSIVFVNFTNIPTNNWNQDIYNLNAYMEGEASDIRIEDFVFRNTTIYSNLIHNYMCSQSTEEHSVTIYHPFNDSIDYNISLDIPTGWNYSGYQWINATSPGNYTVIFNLTSNETNSESIVYANANYTYPELAKSKTISRQIENSDSVSILEIIRETPLEIANYTEFYSRLIVYNKGCAIASDISFTEEYSTGWTAYGQTLDGSSLGETDIPNRQIRFSSSDFGTINAGEYKLIEYRILSDIDSYTTGTVRYNLSWEDKNLYEPEVYQINTTKYSSESHLVFNLKADGSYKEKSAEPNELQLFNLSVINKGDKNIQNNTWNVTLSVPVECTVSNISDSGNFNSETDLILWELGELNVSREKIFNFTMNCTTEGKKILIANGINDTRENTLIIDNNVGIGCAGEDCEIEENYTFSNPGLRYEKHSQIDFYIFYNWTGEGLTLGDGNVKFHSNHIIHTIVWQNSSFENTNGKIWANHTFSSEEADNCENSHIQQISVQSNTSGMYGNTGNVTIEQIVNTWNHGRLFENSQQLFANIKTYVFTPTAPVLETPANDSDAYSLPVVLSWQGQTPPSGVTITYYIYGDDNDAITLLGTTTDTFYLWRGIDSGTYYWNVKAVTSEGQNSSLSETRQFALDLCTPDTDYAYALNYPMSYNETTDTITVWGSNGTDGYDVMGSNEPNSITFEKIYEFGRATRGICAITKPAAGSYAILSRLELGNISSLSNKTFVRTSGESIDFGKQLQLNFNATLISGELTAGGIAQAGSTLSFSGVDAIETEQGQFYLLNGSELRLYDTGVSHKTSANDSAPFKLYWNGNVKAKSSTLQNWYTIRFLGQNNTLNNINLINMGEGFYPSITQIGTINAIKPGNINTGGLVLAENSNVTITNLEISEATNDILVLNYTGTANLINPLLNWSSINWTTGSFSGQINRQYTYLPTIVDATGTVDENVSLVLWDLRGDTIFSLDSNNYGTIPSQTITRAIYDYNFPEGDERGPHTLKIKKFGKNFVTLAKSFSAATVETLQLSGNIFITLSVGEVQNMTGITYVAPTKVNYGNEINSSWSSSGTLAHYPITQSEFFAIFANNTKLIETADYEINYATGELTFYTDMTGYDVRPVYSYGGNLTIATGTSLVNCIDLGKLYSYMQYNLSEVLQTVDGIAYTSYVDLIIGNSTKGGCIIDSAASLIFEDGYTYSFSAIGGYIDLYGVTAGSGAGGLPLNIYDDVGTTYEPGDTVYIFSTTLDSSGALIDSTVSISVYYPNGTLLTAGTSTQTSIGRFKFNFTLGSVPEGTYNVEIDATSSGNQVHDTLVFQVSIGGGASANPEVIVDAPAIINTNTNFSITALTKSNNGIPVNCSSGASITIRDSLLGTNVISGESMTNFATGQYNYTWSTENESTYLATVVCTISAVDYVGTDDFSTLSLGGNKEFVISSLEAVSPKYPNENAIIEATFSNENGSAITPDAINMTVWKPNYLTIWHSATKNDFIESNNVWSWIQMIEGNPTTGTYYVHLNATYNGIISTRVTQFRIATGGPYSVTLNCPDSSQVGSSLDCTLIILDEGEAATESTCNIWVDTNGNLILDSTEPQSQYSQQTVPQQNLSRAVNINVPSSHPIGNYVTRASCIYINSVQPPSNASDSITLTSAGIITPPPSGGGGGGGAPITGKTIPKVIDEEEEIPAKEYILRIFPRILPKYQELAEGDDTLIVEISLENFGTVEYIKEAILEYHIEDSSGNIYLSKTERVNIDKKTILLKEINIPKNMKAGEYWFVGKIEYLEEGSVSREKFEIIKKEKLISEMCCLGEICWFKFVFCWYWWILLIVIIISVLLAKIYRETKRIKSLEEREKLRNLVQYLKRELYESKKKEISSIVLFAIGFFALVNILTLNKGITGGVIGKAIPSTNLNMLVYFVFLVFSFGLLIFIHRQKIKSEIGELKEKGRKKYPKNSIKGLKNKEVYSDSGKHLGKIKEVILLENKIDSLKIKLDKKEFNLNGIIIKWKNVISCGEAIIVNSKIIKHLDK